MCGSKTDKSSKFFAFYILDDQDNLRTNSLYTFLNSKYVYERSRAGKGKSF